MWVIRDGTCSPFRSIIRSFRTQCVALFEGFDVVLRVADEVLKEVRSYSVLTALDRGYDFSAGFTGPTTHIRVSLLCKRVS